MLFSLKSYTLHHNNFNYHINAQCTTSLDMSVCFQNGSFPRYSFSETQHKLYKAGDEADGSLLYFYNYLHSLMHCMYTVLQIKTIGYNEIA